MSISRKVRPLLHAGRRAPQLYRSARRAGAGRRAALEVVVASAGAFTQAAARENGEHGRQNAMRHFVWQAYLAARLGQTVARRVAEDYERGSPDAADSRVDERNNAVAWQYAAAHHDAITGVGRARALAQLADAAEAEWDAGSLAAVSRAPRRRRRGPRTPR